MRLLDRDKKTFYYAPYSSRTMIYDGDYPTGEYTEGYGTPTEMSGTVSVASGRSAEAEFGAFIDYDYVIHIEETPCPFDESAAIWLPGTLTSADPDGRVVRIADARSHTAIAVKKVR